MAILWESRVYCTHLFVERNSADPLFLCIRVHSLFLVVVVNNRACSVSLTPVGSVWISRTATRKRERENFTSSLRTYIDRGGFTPSKHFLPVIPILVRLSNLDVQSGNHSVKMQGLTTQRPEVVTGHPETIHHSSSPSCWKILEVVVLTPIRHPGDYTEDVKSKGRGI